MSAGDAELLLAELAMLGVGIELRGEELILHRASRVTEPLRARLRLCRPAVVALLQSQGGSMLPVSSATVPHRDAMCLSCSGTTFVRLRNGRRSVCPVCEGVEPSEIAGLDSGYLGEPLEDDGGAA